MLGQHGTVHRFGYEACGSSPVVTIDAARGTNRSKFYTAVLLHIVAMMFNEVRTCTLVDSWYMKRPYLEQAENLGCRHSIDQIRRDTALYDSPPAHTRKRLATKIRQEECRYPCCPSP